METQAKVYTQIHKHAYIHTNRDTNAHGHIYAHVHIPTHLHMSKRDKQRHRYTQTHVFYLSNIHAHMHALFLSRSLAQPLDHTQIRIIKPILTSYQPYVSASLRSFQGQRQRKSDSGGGQEKGMISVLPGPHRVSYTSCSSLVSRSSSPRLPISIPAFAAPPEQLQDACAVHGPAWTFAVSRARQLLSHTWRFLVFVPIRGGFSCLFLVVFPFYSSAPTTSAPLPPAILTTPTLRSC